MDEVCRHRRDSIFGRMLRSPCQGCVMESDPAAADRAARAYALVEDYRRGRLSVDDALDTVNQLYGDTP